MTNVKSLTDEQVLAIFQMRSDGASLREIGWFVGCSAQSANVILHRDSYGEVEIDPKLVLRAARNSWGPITMRRNEGINKAQALALRGYTQVEMANLLKVTQPTICRWLKAKPREQLTGE